MNYIFHQNQLTGLSVCLSSCLLQIMLRSWFCDELKFKNVHHSTIQYCAWTSGNVSPDVCMCQYHNLIVFMRSVVLKRAPTHTRSRTRPTPHLQSSGLATDMFWLLWQPQALLQDSVLPINPGGYRNPTNQSRVYFLLKGSTDTVSDGQSLDDNRIRAGDRRRPTV